MTTSFRRLDGAGINSLRQLNAVFALAFEDAKTYGSAPPSDEYLRAFLDNPDTIVLVAEQGGAVVGGLVAYVLTKFEQQRREVYVYDLAVSSACQRQGIGRQLMETVGQIAAELSAYVVFVQADEGDDAVKFYESLRPDENIRARSFDYLTH